MLNIFDELYASHVPGTVQDEEGNSGEHQNDGEVVLLVLALLHRLLSPQHPSATILLCYSVQASNITYMVKCERVTLFIDQSWGSQRFWL